MPKVSLLHSRVEERITIQFRRDRNFKGLIWVGHKALDCILACFVKMRCWFHRKEPFKVFHNNYKDVRTHSRLNKGGYYEEIVFLISRYYVEISEYHSGCREVA